MIKKTPSKIANFWFYKWRYLLGYLSLVLVFAIAIAIAVFYTPNGLHQQEIRSAVTSTNLDLTNFRQASNLINLPFNLLQKASIRFLGLSNFSIKLPAILFAMLAIGSLFHLLSIWVTRRVAILASLIILVSSRLLFLGQFGTPTIALIALPLAAVTILVRLTEDTQILIRRPKLISKQQRRRLCLLLLGLVLSFTSLLYLPMGGFVLAMILATIAFHPSVRLAVRNIRKLLSPLWLILLLVWCLILLTPLILASFTQADTFLQILGVNLFNFKIISNIQANFTEIFFYQSNLSEAFVGAWYNFSALVLIVIGLYREISTAYKPRSAMILMWVTSGLILTAFSAESHILIFTPLALSLAIGLNYVITTWYQIFPRNPYARFFGLVPILVLVFGLVGSGFKIYINSYIHHPLVAPQFTNDLQLLDRQARPFRLIVKANSTEQAFFNLYARSRQGVKLGTDFDINSSERQIATRQAASRLPKLYLQQIITNRFNQQADRFYVYQKTDK